MKKILLLAILTFVSHAAIAKNCQISFYTDADGNNEIATYEAENSDGRLYFESLATRTDEKIFKSISATRVLKHQIDKPEIELLISKNMTSITSFPFYINGKYKLVNISLEPYLSDPHYKVFKTKVSEQALFVELRTPCFKLD